MATAALSARLNRLSSASSDIPLHPLYYPTKLQSLFFPTQPWRSAAILLPTRRRCAAPRASSRADDSPPFDMSVETALKVLGVSEGASFDEILRAKKSIIASRKDDPNAISQVLLESANRPFSGTWMIPPHPKELDGVARRTDLENPKMADFSDSLQKLEEAELDTLPRTKNLFRKAIFNTSCITYLFPKRHFNEKSATTLDMEKILKLNHMMDADTRRRLIDWMEKGAYDALQRKCLKTLTFCIYETVVDGPMIEEYECKFWRAD